MQPMALFAAARLLLLLGYAPTAIAAAVTAADSSDHREVVLTSDGEARAEDVSAVKIGKREVAVSPSGATAAAAVSSSVSGSSMGPVRQTVNGSTPTGLIRMGTPPVELQVIFDTGSDRLVAKTWSTVKRELEAVDGSAADSVKPTGNVYDHGSSETYKREYVTKGAKKMEKRGYIAYGSGIAVTEEGSDIVRVGGRELSAFPLSEIITDSLSVLHRKGGAAGVFGLQHMKNSSVGQSFFSVCRDRGLMTAFGYCRGKNDTGAVIWGDDSSDGQAIPVLGTIHWAVNLTNVEVVSQNSQGAGAAGTSAGAASKTARTSGQHDSSGARAASASAGAAKKSGHHDTSGARAASASAGAANKSGHHDTSGTAVAGASAGAASKKAVAAGGSGEKAGDARQSPPTASGPTKGAADSASSSSRPTRKPVAFRPFGGKRPAAPPASGNTINVMDEKGAGALLLGQEHFEEYVRAKYSGAGDVLSQDVDASFALDVLSDSAGSNASEVELSGASPFARRPLGAEDRVGRRVPEARQSTHSLDASSASRFAFKVCDDKPCTAIIDTGSNIIAGPSTALISLSRMLGVKLDCSNLDELPPLKLQLGSFEATIPATSYVMKVTLPSWAHPFRRPGQRVHPFAQPARRNSSRHVLEEDGAAGTSLEDASAGAWAAAGAWGRVFQDLQESRGIDLGPALHGANLRELLSMSRLCMPALVPINKETRLGSLWVVGTPLFDNYYARWSWPKGEESPAIYMKSVAEANVCKNMKTNGSKQKAAKKAGSVAEKEPASAPAHGAARNSMMRAEARRQPQAHAAELEQATLEGEHSADVREQEVDDIRYPHWAQGLNEL